MQLENVVKTRVPVFELETAKNLSKWWGHDFHRSPASGGLHWAGSNNVAGDIVAPLEANFPFVVECKNREEWTLENLFLNNKDIKNWWAQVVGDAKETGKVPMLIYTRNHAKTFVTLPYNVPTIIDLELEEQSLMVSNITYEDEYGDIHTYKTFTTVLEAVTSITPKTITERFTGDYKWQEISLVRETKKIETAQNTDVEDSMNQMLDQI